MEQYGPKKKRHRRRRRQRPYWDNDFDNQANQNYSPTDTPIPRDPIVCYRCGGLDHIAIGCRIRLDHSRQAYTFQQINAEDRTYAYQQQQSTQDLLGRSPSNLDATSVKAICNLQHTQPFVDTLSMNTLATVDDTSLPAQHLVDIKSEQKSDYRIKEWIYWVSEHRKPTKEQLERSPENTWFVNNFDKLQLKDGILFREATLDCQTVKQLVLPETCGKIDKNTTTTRKLDQPSYKTGDRVLVKILAFDGKHKLADKWEEDPYQIVNQPNKEIPVYEVKKENGTGRKKTLHRNLLLPIGFLPKTVESEIAPAPRQRRKPLRSGRPPTKSVGNSIEKMSASESDEESEQGYWIIETGRSTPSNTDSEVDMVERPRVDDVTISDTGDDLDAVEDVEPAATGQNIEDDTLESDNGSALTEDPSLDEMADEPTHDETTRVQPVRERRRRYLPTPPRHIPEPTTLARPQRNRKPPKYLQDYVTTSKQATTKPDWLAKVHWLENQAETGRFRGLEMELSRAIIKIIENSS
ncbi:Hypothetical predicted protein [Mytilus galloprovincialis]|uniref:CCHC-type domain-containing protein n=1 Tax=Mytilus galloprovincialis TaxID=29158 RepID=A0A8B6FQU8_MYTGA|nr:Hypothetical predicted protein [Mytilus galloprovincialis]